MKKKYLGLTIIAIIIFAANLEAHALALEAFCQWPSTIKTIEQLSQKLNYGPEARNAKPNFIIFSKTEFQPMRCVYSFAYGNVFDFGSYQAIIQDDNNFQLHVTRIEPYKEKR